MQTVRKRNIFAGVDCRQPLLARLGCGYLGLAVVCLAAMALDPQTINGVSVWVKPAKFALSFVVWFWTLAWAWGVLNPAAQRGKGAKVVLWATIVAAAFEQIWITLRAGFGQPSHFADDALGRIMYLLMGVGAVTLVSMAALLGVLVLRHGEQTQPQAWRLAVGLGLVLGGVLGGLTGASISVVDTPHIGGTLNDAANLAPFFWSRDGGDLRVAHFLGVHAMQALPALALLGAGVRLVWLGAAGWSAITLLAYAAALNGISLSP